MSIPSYLDWMTQHKDKTWLLVGKGPSFIRYLDLPSDHGFMVLGLNNVCSKREVDATSILDHHVIGQTGDHLVTSSKVLFLPWYLNVECKLCDRPLPDFLNEIPQIRTLSGQGRLFTYNSWLAYRLKKGPGPVVYFRYFGGVAGVGLLASAGVKSIRVVGLDGGAKYSDVFDKKNLFLNGRSSFDIQFGEIKKIVKKHKIDYDVLEQGRRSV